MHNKLFCFLLVIAITIPTIGYSEEVGTSIEKNMISKDQILITEQSMIDVFIKDYNSIASIPITDAVEINVTDNKSEHYRVEFRLGAFQTSIAKTAKIGDIAIDLVNCGWDNDELRLYADGITSQQAIELVKYAAPIMDPSLQNEELQEVLDYLDGTKFYHDGYFGNLCISFNQVHGQLMLRTD